jgi:DNA replication and repair protein RecF
MDIKWLSLTNFRNLKSGGEIELPSKGLLVAAAPNATGKTNFLESVAVLLRGKSFRAKVDECVGWGQDSFIVQGEIERAGETNNVAVRYHHPSRKMRIEEDKVPASVVAFYSHYPFVLFLPEDTFLLSRGPAQRRNLLNHVLVCHPHYVAALVQYHRALRQRNAALKKVTSFSDIQAWTEILAEQAATVWQHRENFVSYINSKLSDMYGRLSGEKRLFEVELAYGSSDVANFMGELERSFAHERNFGYTMNGPHRDDMVITTGGREAQAVLSRGQTRSLVIALKVVSHGYMNQITKEEPLLLLDDVLSELDDRRKEALLENLPGTQTILTCTSVPKALRNRDDVYLLDLRSIVQTDEGNKKDKMVFKRKEIEVDDLIELEEASEKEEN